LFFSARTEQYGGAWCPLNDVDSKASEWLEIDLGNLTYLTQVETQGRFDNGRGKEYADYYVLMYARMDMNRTNWIEYKPINNENNSSWIRANRNTYFGEIRLLSKKRRKQTVKSLVDHFFFKDPPIIAKRIRFYPVSKQTRSVCMRVELYVHTQTFAKWFILKLNLLLFFSYGCPFSDNIVSYSMPQGRVNINSLGDDTYDGEYIPAKNLLINGLGQLSDGITGTEEISVINGYQPWIGWSNETNGYISIRFEFDAIRQINRMSIHTNNLFSRDILIFRKAIISFSIRDNEKNSSEPIVYQHQRDDIFEIARPILIELHNRIAKYVRVDLYFDSKWLLISEITFDSQIYNPDKSTTTIVNEQRKRYREIYQTTTTFKTLRMKASPMITMELSLAFFIGALLAVSTLLIVTLIWIVRRKKKLQFHKLTDKPCHNSSCSTYPTLPIREFHDFNTPLTNAIDDREYAVPDLNFYSTFSPRLMRPSTSIKSIPHCCAHQSPRPVIYMPPVQDAPSVEASCGNSLMMTMLANDHQLQSFVKDLNANDLVVVKKIGDGLFGSIHLGELQIAENEKQLVIVKTLNNNVDENQK